MPANHDFGVAVHWSCRRRTLVPVLLLGLTLTACGSGERPAPKLALRVAARVPLGSNISELAARDGLLWVSGSYDRGVLGVDMASGKVVAELPTAHGNIPGGGAALSVEDTIWVAYAVGTDPPDGFDAPPPPNIQEVYRRGALTTADLYRVGTAGGLVRFNPHSRRPEKTMLFLDWTPTSVAVTQGTVWIAVDGVARIDPTTYMVVARLPEVGILAAGLGSLWVAGDDVIRIDPQTNTVTARITTPPVRDIAVGPDAVWVTTEQSLLRIDAESNRVDASIPLEEPWGVAADEDAVWVTGFRTGTLWRVDPRTMQITASIGLGGTMMTDVVASNGSAWVAYEPGDSSRAAVIRVEAA